MAAGRDPCGSSRSWTSAPPRPRPRGSPARPRSGRSTARRSRPTSSCSSPRTTSGGCARASCPSRSSCRSGSTAPRGGGPGVRRPHGRVPRPGRPRRRAARRHAGGARLQDREGVRHARGTARTRSSAAPGCSSRCTRRRPVSSSAPPRSRPRTGSCRRGVGSRSTRSALDDAHRGAVPRGGRPHRRQHRRGHGSRRSRASRTRSSVPSDNCRFCDYDAVCPVDRDAQYEAKVDAPRVRGVPRARCPTTRTTQ